MFCLAPLKKLGAVSALILMSCQASSSGPFWRCGMEIGAQARCSQAPRPRCRSWRRLEISSTQPPTAASASVANQLRGVRANAGRDREQKAATAAFPEEAGQLIADQRFAYLQRTTIWPASVDARRRGERTLGRLTDRKRQALLGDVRERVDVDACRRQGASERLRGGAGLARLIRRQQANRDRFGRGQQARARQRS